MHVHTHEFGSFFAEVTDLGSFLVLGDHWLNAEQCIICLMADGEHIQGSNGRGTLSILRDLAGRANQGTETLE